MMTRRRRRGDEARRVMRRERTCEASTGRGRLRGGRYARRLMYEGTVDLENTNNSHTFAVQMIGGNKRVLEFGCASGFVTKALVARGCRVVSVEIDPEFASQAKEF